jgi:hypothetical protein
MGKERFFPIQGEFDRANRVDRPSGSVPWGIAEAAYVVYARRHGTSQSLQQLADRGGFSWSELVGLLRDDEEMPFIPVVPEKGQACVS